MRWGPVRQTTSSSPGGTEPAAAQASRRLPQTHQNPTGFEPLGPPPAMRSKQAATASRASGPSTAKLAIAARPGGVNLATRVVIRIKSSALVR